MRKYNNYNNYNLYETELLPVESFQVLAQRYTVRDFSMCNL